MVRIHYRNPIWSYLTCDNAADLSWIRHDLAFNAEYWVDGPYHKERKTYQKTFLFRDNTFFTGFTDRVLTICKARGLTFKIEPGEFADTYRKYAFKVEPQIGKIDLRGDQNRMVESALRYCRGVILAPTGIGKTVLAMGIVNSLKDCKTLFLVHSTDIVKQTKDAFRDTGAFKIGEITNKKINPEQITISTMQTVSRLDASQYQKNFDCVIVDECHYGMKFRSGYFYILTHCLAPLRFGLTATLPDAEESRMVLEGLIGPVVSHMTINEGIEKDLLSHPKIRIVKIPFNHSIRDLRAYPDVYEHGIVSNRSRNREILRVAGEEFDKGHTVLILVTKIQHGKTLSDLSEVFMGRKIPFAYGEISPEQRVQWKDLLKKRQIKAVIADAVWKHGIDIPSLNCIINAAGEKSECNLLQRIGRGFRRTSEKDEFLIVDFFDPSHPYLISHFGERFSLYCDMGWVS